MTTQYILFYQIKRIDKKIFYFNQSNQDIFFDGNKYLAAYSKDLSINQDFKESNLKFEAALMHEYINMQDILNGLYDNAVVYSFLVDFSIDVNQQKKMFLQRGLVTQVKIFDQDKFWFEVKGFSELVDCNINQRYSLNCRADFGDYRCGVDLTKYYYYGVISMVIGEKTFFDENCIFDDAYFENGSLVLLDSLYGNWRTKIQFYFNKTFELYVPPHFALKKDIKFLAIPGCDKTIQMCGGRFKNAVNFRGEPFIPGLENIYSNL